MPAGALCAGAGTLGRAGPLLSRRSSSPKMPGEVMLKWALIFLVISLIAGALGFSGLARGAARIAKILFVVFLLIFVLIVVLAVLAGQAVF